MNRACSKSRAKVARLVGGELSTRSGERLERHLEICDHCRALRADLHGLEKLVGQTYGGVAGGESGFRSVLPGLSARLDARRAPDTVRAPVWSILAPVAALVAVMGFLLLAAERQALVPVVSTDSPQLSLSSLKDSSDVVVQIDNADAAVHRVAVSADRHNLQPARVFEVRGGRADDPMPVPASGQVFYYRID